MVISADFFWGGGGEKRLQICPQILLQIHFACCLYLFLALNLWNTAMMFQISSQKKNLIIININSYHTEDLTRKASTQRRKPDCAIEPNKNISYFIKRIYLWLKGDYTRTRASYSKHLPALIHSMFLVNILGLCLIFGLSTKKLGFTIVLYEKNFEMLNII